MVAVEVWKKAIESGLVDNDFKRLYEDREETVLHQRQRYLRTLQNFETQFGADREVALYSTPGRTEIGGNHTDHNQGIVMAAGVNLDIIAVAAHSDDNCIKVASEGFFCMDKVDLAMLEPVEQEFGTSAGMVRGVAAGIAALGGQVGALDVFTTSDVLPGSGLSSSAAFEVCIASVLNGEFNEERFTPVQLAQVSQRAENLFFGKPSGLMDQTACAVGGAVTIDFEDPQNPVVNSISLPLSAFGYHLFITDTKGTHAGLTSAYAAIRTEMEAVAGQFGKRVLREVPFEDFISKLSSIREKVGDRAVLRAIHFYEECRRVPLLVAAIETRDFAQFLRLITEGGNSSFEYNQNAYVNTDPEHQGVSLGLALSQLCLNGRGAWRLQGGGFAGTIQAFVPDDLLESYRNLLESVFGEGSCHILSVRDAGCLKLDFPQ